MTKKELINSVSDRSEINRTEFEKGFNDLIQIVKETITKGEPIYIRGFGTLKNVTRATKCARNIKTSEMLIVPKHNEPVFKPSKEFKKQVKK